MVNVGYSGGQMADVMPVMGFAFWALVCVFLAAFFFALLCGDSREVAKTNKNKVVPRSVSYTATATFTVSAPRKVSQGKKRDNARKDQAFSKTKPKDTKPKDTKSKRSNPSKVCQPVAVPSFVNEVSRGLSGMGVSSKEAKMIATSTYCKNHHKNATDLLNDCLKTL